MFWKSDRHLFMEKKVCLPNVALQSMIQWAHRMNGHPGVEKTCWFLKSLCHIALSTDALTARIKGIVDVCAACLLSKPNLMTDRGLVGGLPLPNMVNELVMIDFFEVDPYNGRDFILTICDSLSRFAQFVPLTKKSDGEKVLRLFYERWISVYGRCKEVYSDNDIRFGGVTGWWQSALRSMRIQTTFSSPRHPASNGLCEKVNGMIKTILRCLLAESKSANWLELLPIATHMYNSQIQPATGYSPQELFFGRPMFHPFEVHCLTEDDMQPCVKDWVQHQQSLWDSATSRLKRQREIRMKRKNKARKPTTYEVGTYVLVHKSRLPHLRVQKFGTQWFGPFRIISLKNNAVVVRSNPNAGGAMEVCHSFLKHYPLIDDAIESDSDGDDEMIAQEDDAAGVNPDPIEDVPTVQLSTDDDPLAQGSFIVNQILKHKYRQGYRFLTAWQGYPLNEATWEPVNSFVRADGALNIEFQRYCESHRMETALRQAARVMARRQR